MTTPLCRDCLQPIQWIDGKPYDLGPCLHYRSCTARKARPKAQKKVLAPLVYVNGKALEPSKREGGSTAAEHAVLLERLAREAGA